MLTENGREFRPWLCEHLYRTLFQDKLLKEQICTNIWIYVHCTVLSLQCT